MRKIKNFIYAIIKEIFVDKSKMRLLQLKQRSKRMSEENLEL